MNVYDLFPDANRYQTLAVKNDADLRRTRAFNVTQPMSADWTPIRVGIYKDVGGKALKSDYPGWAGVPVFSERAVQALGELLTANGELLPLACEEGTYFACNILTVIDALDEQRSDVERLSNGNVFHINRYEFVGDRVRDAAVFKIPQSPRKFVTDQFVQRVEAARLRGLRFDLLWSLPDR